MKSLWNRSVLIRIAVLMVVAIALSLGSYHVGFGAGVAVGSHSDSTAPETTIRQVLEDTYPSRRFTDIYNIHLVPDIPQLQLGGELSFEIAGKAKYEMRGWTEGVGDE